jgi:hypothetical protein
MWCEIARHVSSGIDPAGQRAVSGVNLRQVAEDAKSPGTIPFSATVLRGGVCAEGRHSGQKAACEVDDENKHYTGPDSDGNHRSVISSHGSDLAGRQYSAVNG